MEINELYRLVRSSAGICTDTRTLKTGEVFLALRGPNHDGNKYAAAAISSGAIAAITDDRSLQGAKIITVENTLQTLAGLATIHRKNIKVPVIAITGTNGKTTTKELISAVLSSKGRTYSTPGNLNNHIGVPLTLLAAPDDAAFIVIEMGANHKGEIASLCEVAMPSHGLITNIGKAHLEGFGSYNDIIEAKSELYHWLRKSGGIAFYNELNPTLKELIFHIVHKAVPYSDPTGTDLTVTAGSEGDLCISALADFEGRHYSFTTNLFGSYNIDNIRAAMAVGLFFGAPVEKIIEAISSYKPSNNRSQVRHTGKNTLICDSYNANPSSMARALSFFSETARGKRMVILGDMLELGRESLAEHARIIEILKTLDETEIYLVGPQFGSAATGSLINTVPGSEALKEVLRKKSPEGYTILVKGSRGMTLEKIYEVL